MQKSNNDPDVIRSFLKEDDSKVQEIISKMRFIGNLKPNQIMDVNTLSLSDSNWQTSLYRTMINLPGIRESRDITYNFINTSINEAIYQASKYISSSDNFHIRTGLMVLASIDEAKNGIRNLTETYRNDTHYVSKINTLLETLENKLETLRGERETHLNSSTNSVSSTEDF